jgi:hypothetical protein
MVEKMPDEEKRIFETLMAEDIDGLGLVLCDASRKRNRMSESDGRVFYELDY